MTGARLAYAARSDVGPRRSYNEDAVALFTTSGRRSSGDVFAGEVPAEEGAALVVLDGMGGQSTGDRACRLVLAALAERLAGAWPEAEARGAWLAEALRGASERVKAEGTPHAGQAATAAMAVVVGEEVHLVNVGDVRVYVLQGGRLEQRTRDDSLENDARDHGVSEAELREIPRGVITQALGFGAPVPRVRALRLAVGDGLLLCSNGLYEAVERDVMEAALRGRGPAEACEALVERAIRANSDDNISAVVVRLEA